MFGARGLIKEHGDTVLALAVESEHQRKGIGTAVVGGGFEDVGHDRGQA